MIDFVLLAAVPKTVGWSPAIGIIMIVCNVLAIAIGKATMKEPNAGKALPQPEFFGGMGWSGLLATTSFGHVLGMGTILGLSNLGLLG